MAIPVFSWFVQEDEQFNIYKNYTQPGSLKTGEELIKNIRIYNGYGGQEVENSYDTKLVVSFKKYEDNFLLNLFEIKINDSDYQKLNVDIDRATIDLGTIYKNSYIDLKIKIGPIPENIISSLKSVIFYLENNN